MSAIVLPNANKRFRLPDPWRLLRPLKMFDGQFYPYQPIQFQEGLLTPVVGGRAVYINDFSQYTVGTTPSDWTKRWDTTGYTALVQTVAGSISGKALRWTKSVSGRNLMSWDVIPAAADIEFLFRWRAISAWATNDNILQAVCRASGAALSGSAYHCFPAGYNTNTLYYTAVRKTVAGTNTGIGTTPFGPAPNLVVNAWCWTRFRVSGTTITTKTWHDGAAESTGLGETFTDSSVTAGGWVGLGNSGTTPNTEIDYFSVGVFGDTALGP